MMRSRAAPAYSANLSLQSITCARVDQPDADRRLVEEGTQLGFAFGQRVRHLPARSTALAGVVASVQTIANSSSRLTSRPASSGRRAERAAADLPSKAGSPACQSAIRGRRSRGASNA